MSILATTAATAPQICNKHELIVRRTAKFQPGIWGDQFLNYKREDFITDAMKKQVEELKAVVRREAFINVAVSGNSSHQLKLIDAIQRLGVAYHFEMEIDEALEKYYHHGDHDADLYSVALRFRLLRQHGYDVSCDIFNQFKDVHGNFKESLAADVSSMLSLYEAAHLRVHGEKLLEEALIFTTTHLHLATTSTDYVSPMMKEQITEALERPVLKTLERLGARRYMSIYQHEALANEDLLKFAKLDFNLVQCSHKEELSELVRWYKELDFKTKLPFVRDRMVELFFWIVGVYFEPQYVLGRKIMTKLIVITTAMDDIYDAYATFDELVILTKAIERWDVRCLDQLPDCSIHLKSFYKDLLNLVDEIERELIEQGRSYRAYYLKEVIKNQARLYFAEAKWLHEAYTPGMDEYMRVASASVGNTLLWVISLVGMGDIVTKDAFEWVDKYPKILRASNVMFRLMDDIAGNKFEKERGHVPSCVDCYMKQYGVSEQEALDVFNTQIVDSWKDINQELIMRPTAVPRPVLNRILNLTRVVDLLYKREDAFTHVGKLTKDSVTSLFIDPVPL